MVGYDRNSRTYFYGAYRNAFHSNMPIRGKYPASYFALGTLRACSNTYAYCLTVSDCASLASSELPAQKRGSAIDGFECYDLPRYRVGITTTAFVFPTSPQRVYELLSEDSPIVLPIVVIGSGYKSIAARRRPSALRRNPWIELQNLAGLGGSRTTQKSDQDLDSHGASTTQQPSVYTGDAVTLEGEVLKAVRMNRSFCLPSVAPDIELTDLPNLESVTEYGVTEEVEETLWAKEATRLVHTITSNTPPEFIGSADLTFDTASSYDILAGVADQIWHAVHIDTYDAGNVLAEYCPRLANYDMKRIRRILEHFCGEEDDAVSRQTMTPERREDFFSLVNYCTAIIARVVCGAAEGSSLHVNILAHLVRISTKLKVLSAKLLDFSEISLSHTAADLKFNHQGYTGLRGRLDKIDNGPEVDILDSLRGMKMGRLEEEGAATKEDALRNIYFAQCSKFRIGIHHLLRLILLSLKGTSQLSNTSLSSYEMCAIVYESGFEGFPILVFQDNQDDLLGTSDASHLNCARSGFDVLDQAVRHVQGQIERSSSESETATGSSNVSGNRSSSAERDCIEKSMGTSIHWSYPPNGRDVGATPQGTTRLKSMSHIITVVIPLLMTDPRAADGIQDLIDMAVYAELYQERLVNPVKPRSYGKYTAFFSLSTADRRKTQENRKPQDAKSLSSAIMRCNNLYMGTALGLFPSSVPSDESAVELVQRRRVELDSIAHIMEKWVFEEKGVMVQCRKYVLGWMFTCLLLVTGGLAVGASLGQRLSGVDPFNITTYSWVLAAFFLLVAKSIRVENWSWNDFLHGRVLCKSVSELSSVTGIDDQFIFVKLLQDERESFLETRGPYNVVFRRKSQDGFSIDRPLNIWAMLLSGLIMVETESTRGRSLVCLDLRLGTKFQLIGKLGDAEIIQDEPYIHSARVLDNKSNSHDVSATRIRLAHGKFQWLRTVGIYANQETEFI
ncbi:hypothetical protein EV127DRAFT_474363 [Xylaria flabelliformis]|nr:hypothetical protein EV127DRAFT_474363 [Xylaria flabelliformis]